MHSHFKMTFQSIHYLVEPHEDLVKWEGEALSYCVRDKERGFWSRI